MKRRVRMGMVGGGPGAFIGGVHRMAARLDGKIELVCGAFSRDPEKSRGMAKELFLPEERCYPDFATMFAREAALPEGERMDFVAIVTPNNVHYPAASAALGSGFHVVCDKPMTYTLDEARALLDEVTASGRLFMLTHNYSAFPMVRQMRKLVADGELGAVRKVVAEYDLGWLAAENAGKQAAWRVDPAQSGKAACVGDIGTHAEHLIEFVTGLRIESVCADLSTFVPGRRLDDDASILLRLENGARGVIEASEVATGEENQFSLRVYGQKASLTWWQQKPEELVWRTNDGPMRILRRSWVGMDESLVPLTRLPAGHPEGFIEAFANLYSAFADAVADVWAGRTPPADAFPGAEAGWRGMSFVNAVVESSAADARWTPV